MGEPRVRPQAGVADPGGPVRGLAQHAFGVAEPAERVQRPAKVDLGTDAQRIGDGKERDRSFEQPGRACLVALADPVSGFDQAGRGAVPELRGLGVAQPELDPVPVRLFQVIPDQLIMLTGAPHHPGLQPGGEALVQLGALALRCRLVGAVAQQDVQEPEGLHTGQVRPVGMNQFLAYQRLAVRGHAGPVRRGGQFDHRVEVEPLTDNGGTFQHPPLVHVEPVETGREQRGDRGWDLDRAKVAGRDPPVALPAQQPVVDQGRERLFDEQRVPRG